MSVFDPFGDLPEPTEVTYAEGRYTTRTYVSRSFAMQFGGGSFYRKPRGGAAR